MPSLKHKFQTVIPDGVDTSVVRPSNWNDEHDLLQSSGFLLGRMSVGVGPTEELSPAQIRTFIDFNTSADIRADARIAAAIGVSVQGWTAVLQATTASYTVALNTKLNGIATGADVTVSALPVAIHAAVSKSPPVDADELALADSAAAFGLKKLTWANVKSAILAYFYPANKAVPIDGDLFSFFDSIGNTLVYASWLQFKAFMKTYFDTLYVGVGTYTAANVLAKMLTVDGTGSGLDADLLDGLNSSAAATASTVAVRDAQGDVVVRLVRTEYAGGGGTGAFFLTQNALGSGTDNYARPMPLATVQTTLGIVFTKSYVSPQQTITSAGALTLAHSLGVKPPLIYVCLQCTTAELGYSIGDEVAIGLGTQVASGSRGVGIVPDATNLVCRYGADATAFIIVNKTTGASASPTNANWRMVVRAWA